MGCKQSTATTADEEQTMRPVSPMETAPTGEVSDEKLAKEYDLVVVGGGPAGVAGAVKAAVLGRRVLLVGKPKVAPDSEGLYMSFGGPTGLFSKALRKAGKKIDINALRTQQLGERHIWGHIMDLVKTLATNNAQHQVNALRDFKVGYLQASATIKSPKSLVVKKEDGRKWTVKTLKIMVATGSKPSRPDTIPYDDVRVFDSDTINTLKFLPKQVAISGSGIISIEYAKIFHKLGAEVWLLVRGGVKSSLERIGLDPDIADVLVRCLETDGIHICEKTEVNTGDVSVPSKFNEDNPLAQKVRIGLKTSGKNVPSELSVDIWLAALGRKANVTGFGLEDLKVKLGEKGEITVNEKFETSVPGIFAVGDAIGAPSLASTGAFQAQQAAIAMYKEGQYEMIGRFPVGIWTVPECSYFGLTRKEAEAKGYQVEEGVAKYTDCLRGRVFSPEGLLKLIFRKCDNQNNGQIVGVHIIGDDACELVHYGMDLVISQQTIFNLITAVYTAVTFHELFKEAALDGNSKLEFGAEWRAILAEVGQLMEEPCASGSDNLKKAFDEIDTTQDGYVTANELAKLFERLGKPVSRGTLANLIRLADRDGSGTISFEEFNTIVTVAIAQN